MTHEQDTPTLDTVEAVVRRQMAQSLGGRRGLIEAGVPGLLFTLTWLTLKELQLALLLAGSMAAVLLVLRLLQRSTVQYVMNAVIGVGIGWLFVRWAGSSGGSEAEQALAFFLPGIVWSGAYTLVMVGSVLAGWPFVGFLVGSVTGDPTAWHDDPQIVRLCSRLTWLFLAPGAIGVLLQGPVYVLGATGAIDTDLAVGIIGVLRLGLGWALRIASWGGMVWLLARDATPVQRVAPVEPDRPGERP
ncbi:MAG TPA: DUF3159 domain-containing protein [Nocardioides sp.]|uniref:DUF3159 domain-containing protein n=1 Tax=Nocardioides sp. TaxID=35761 RepID=UPI002EDAC9D2